MSTKTYQNELGHGAYVMHGRTIEPMPMYSRWRVHGVALAGLAPDESVLGHVLHVSHVDPDGSVWLRDHDGQARRNTPEWWQQFCSKAD